MKIISPFAKVQFAVKIDFCPGVAEIGDPGNIKLFFKSEGNQVHGVRWAGGNNGINRIICEIVRQEFYRRLNPEFPGIRNEKVTTNPHCNFFGKIGLLFLT